MLAVYNFVHERYPDLPITLAGFSFGAYVQSVVSETVHPAHLLLVGPAVNMFHMGEAPPHTVVLHGEKDQVVPLAEVRDWAHKSGFTLGVVRDADHFFHKKLSKLKEQILDLCPC